MQRVDRVVKSNRLGQCVRSIKLFLLVIFLGCNRLGFVLQNLITSHSELNGKMLVGSGPDVFTRFPVCSSLVFSL